MGNWPGGVLLAATGAVAVGAMLLGVRRGRSGPPRSWQLLTAGLLATVVGQTLAAGFADWRGSHLPSLADGARLVGYAFLLPGALTLLHRRGRPWSSGALVDSAILGTGAGLYSWVFIVAPLGVETSAGVLCAAYAALDVAVLGLLWRLATNVRRRTPAFQLLFVGVLLLLVGDVLAAASIMNDPPVLVPVSRVASYCCFAAAALRATPAVQPPAIATPVTLSTRRLVALAVAALTAPGVLAFELARGDVRDGYLVVVAGGWIVLLVIARMAGLVSRIEQQAKVLAEQAATDGLTGLPNRRAWDAALARETSRARRDAAPLAVALVDLDHFKQFNDTRGHLAGDELLRTAAKAWRNRLRPGDLLCRYGGEEFALLLPRCALEDAVDLVDELRRRTPGEQTLSAGVAAYEGLDEPQDVVARADAALYEAKRKGRDQVLVSRKGRPVKTPLR